MTEFPSAPPDADPELERVAPPDRRLYHGGLVLLAAALIYYGFNSNTASTTELYAGLTIIGLASLPALLWARRGTYEFPIFEVFMLTGVNIYALPLLNRQEELQGYADSVVMQAALAVILFQAVLIVTYAATHGRARTTPFWTEEVISKDTGAYLGYGLVVTTIYIGVSTFTDLIPTDLEGPLRAVSYGIGIISTFIQGWRWGQKELRGGEKIFFAANIVLQVLFNFTTLYLISGISIIVLAMLGYVSGGKRLPLLGLVAILPVIAVLHNGKTAMRAKYWENNIPTVPRLMELPGFFAEWFQDGLKYHPKAGLTGKLIERTSLFQMICLVVDHTPHPLPFLDGETYAQIPGQFVPRPFWPEKPVGHISTYTLSIYYGLQRPEDTAKTTIAFGLLAEAYANFGFYGVGFLAVFFAFSLKKFCLWTQQSPMFSSAGLLLVLLMAWSFQTELTLSIWLSSLFQAAVAVLSVPFVLRHFRG